jgi:hypothetical protein
MTYRDEFPDFPEADMPAIPAGWEDTSWHNDAMPSFVNERRMLRLWINYSDVSLQDIQGGKRFLLVREHADHSPDESDELFASDSWSDVLAFLASVP